MRMNSATSIDMTTLNEVGKTTINKLAARIEDNDIR